MCMNWIMVDRTELDDTQEVWLSGARAEHIRSVLRLSVGDQIRMTCVNGPRGKVQLGNGGKMVYGWLVFGVKFCHDPRLIYSWQCRDLKCCVDCGRK